MDYLNQVQIDSPKRRQVQKGIINYLSPFLSNINSVIDVGCGKGEFITQVQAKSKFAIDLDPNAGSFLHSGISFIHGTHKSLSNFERQTIDVIWASNFVEHLEMQEVDSFLEECHRILNRSVSSGYLILMQPNFKYSFKNYFDDFTHKTIFTDVSLRSLLNSHGFKVVKCERKFLPYSLNSRKAFFSPLIRIYLKSRIRIFGGQMLIIATPQGK